MINAPTKKDLADLIRRVQEGDENAMLFFGENDMGYIECACKLIPESALVELEVHGGEKLW